MSADALTARIYQTLADAFGYRTFRPYQEEIVRALLDRRDVFAVMPTGGGKSLCYQLPALLTPGVCVVVSPLLSLMKDQVDAAQKNGICAATLNSTTSLAELREIYASADRRTLDLLYVSPERFNTPRFQEFLSSVELGFFAVDEAHCISQWGHNFRADYLELGQIAELFPNCPIAAFTATATDRVSDVAFFYLNYVHSVISTILTRNLRPVGRSVASAPPRHALDDQPILAEQLRLQQRRLLR